MTPHFARPSFLLLLPKLPPIQEEEVLLLRELFYPIQYDSLIFINHKVHTNLFHGFASWAKESQRRSACLLDITSLPYYQLFTIYVGKDKHKSRNRQAISGFIMLTHPLLFFYLYLRCSCLYHPILNSTLVAEPFLPGLVEVWGAATEKMF